MTLAAIIDRMKLIIELYEQKERSEIIPAQLAHLNMKIGIYLKDINYE